MKKITYKGKTLNSAMWEKPISEELFNKLKTQYYAKPDFKEVEKEFQNIELGKVKVANITKYYFRDLMSKVQQYRAKWTIEDAWEYKELLEHFYWKTKHGYEIFNNNQSDIKNIETAFRLGGGGASGIVCKPANFPLKVANEILDTYNVNNNFYDYSCGWGIRLLSSLKHRINYFGTDPNYLLTERLEQLITDYKRTIGIECNTDIRTQGSEVFIPEWENKIGLAFSSPPYYNLEDYKIGNQSYKQGVTYEQWLNNYLEPTFQNIYKYLVENGHFLLNVKSYDKYSLLEDSLKLAKKNGFVLTDQLPLKNIQRVVDKKKNNNNTNIYDNSEKILVFKKK